MISLRKTNAVSELSRKTGRPTSWRATVTAFASINSRKVAGTDVEVSHLLASGLHYPPPSVTLTPTSKNTQCTVLVYEFEKSADSKDTDELFRQKGRMTAQEHLAKASLWTALESTQ